MWLNNSIFHNVVTKWSEKFFKILWNFYGLQKLLFWSFWATSFKNLVTISYEHTNIHTQTYRERESERERERERDGGRKRLRDHKEREKGREGEGESETDRVFRSLLFTAHWWISVHLLIGGSSNKTTKWTACYF